MNQAIVKQHMFPFLLITILISLIYSNSLNSTWHFDDIQMIVENPKIQINSLSQDSFKNSLFSNPLNPKTLYRPLPCFSFAINAFWGGTNVFGYHLVNITLHILTALILMKLLTILFKTPALKDTQENEKNFTIILATLLWAINPIQTQAVTYIVQRMTILSAFFTLSSIFFYLKARLSFGKLKKYKGYTVCLICFILSLLSKENGAVTPLLIVCTELTLFNNHSFSFLKNKFFLCLLTASLATIIFGCYALEFNPLSFLNYSERPFTMSERILTQPRILIYYLTQIFYPLPNRLSLEHDLIISTSLFSPPQTFVSIIIIFIMLTASIFIKKLHPIFKLAILFYLCGHIIESSIIPLEMIFEHRNYLPSALIFAPLGIALYQLCHKHGIKNSLSGLAATVFLASIIFLFSIWTYSRNIDWLTEENLWKDAAEKAPNSARPKHNLGVLYADRHQYDEALSYYSSALISFSHHKKYHAATLGNIGNIYSSYGEYKKAHFYWDKAIELNPNLAIAYLAKTEGLIKEKKWGEALEFLNLILRKAPNNFSVNRFMAICSIHAEDYQTALNSLRLCLKAKPEDKYTLMNIAEILSLTGFSKQSDLLYKICISNYPNELSLYLGMAKNNYLNGNLQMAALYLKTFFKLTGSENTQTKIKLILNDYELPMIYFEKMSNFINKNFDEYKKEIKIQA